MSAAADTPRGVIKRLMPPARLPRWAPDCACSDAADRAATHRRLLLNSSAGKGPSQPCCNKLQVAFRYTYGIQQPVLDDH